MKKFFTIIVFMEILNMATRVLAAPPTVANYRNVVQGIQAKFDRDWNSLNPQGKPDPGAVAIIETFLTAMNTFGIQGPGTYHVFFDSNNPLSSCQVVGPNCQEMKLLVRNSIHANDATLFGAQHAYQWDIIGWSNTGNGFARFFEGFYTPTAHTAGQANITVISCSGCSTVGHSQIEWDGTGLTYHLRSLMYDTRFTLQNPQVYGGVVVDAQYVPAAGDMKLAISAKNVCDSSGVGDSICSNGPNDHTTGYAAMVHANTVTGNVYVEGIQGINSSLVVPTTGALCIKADKSLDVGSATCHADGIDTFNGIAPYAPNDAPLSFIGAGNPWPMVEITDTPSF